MRKFWGAMHFSGRGAAILALLGVLAYALVASAGYGPSEAVGSVGGAVLLAFLADCVLRRPQRLEARVAAATAELVESKERFRLLFDQAPIAVIVAEPQTGRLLEFNTLAHLALGYSRAEFEQLTLGDIDVSNPPRGQAIPAETTQARFRRKDGAVLQVIASHCQVVLGGRPVLHYVWRDVTEEAEARDGLARERALLKALIDSIPDYIFFKDENSVYLGCNKAYEARAGRREKELIGHTDHDFYPREEAEFYRTKDQEMLSAGRPLRIEESVRHPDGSVSWFDTIKTPFFGPHGEALGLVGICRDITLRKRAEQQLRLSDTVFEAAAEGILIADAERRIIRVNGGFCRITGYDVHEVLGQNPRLLNSRRHDAAFFERMWQDLAESGRWEGEIWNRRKSGEIYPEWLSITAIENSVGEVEQYVGVFTDITQRKRDEAFMVHQATHDPLTGLPNRALFMERLKQGMAHAVRNGTTLALLFIDLDEFKSVNDTLGHEMGDVLLCATARRLGGSVRDEDTVARLGGDEFTVILGEVDGRAGATVVAEKIRQTLASPLSLAGKERQVSASIGIALSGPGGADPATLLRNADRAMYEAKRNGRNRYCFWDDVET